MYIFILDKLVWANCIACMCYFMIADYNCIYLYICIYVYIYILYIILYIYIYYRDTTYRDTT